MVRVTLTFSFPDGFTIYFHYRESRRSYIQCHICSSSLRGDWLCRPTFFLLCTVHQSKHLAHPKTPIPLTLLPSATLTNSKITRFLLGHSVPVGSRHKIVFSVCFAWICWVSGIHCLYSLCCLYPSALSTAELLLASWKETYFYFKTFCYANKRFFTVKISDLQTSKYSWQYYLFSKAESGIVLDFRFLQWLMKNAGHAGCADPSPSNWHAAPS